MVRGFLLAGPPPLPLGATVLSTPVSCMQLSALLFPIWDFAGPTDPAVYHLRLVGASRIDLHRMS